MIGIFALGIGFSTALALFVQSIVRGPVPGIPRQEALVRIRGIDPTQPGRAIGREFSTPNIWITAPAQRTLFSDVAAWTSSDIVFDVGGREANPRRRDLRRRQRSPGAGPSPGPRRGPPDRRERRRFRAAAHRRDQPRAVETLRALAGRHRPRDESQWRHRHDRRRCPAPIRRRADGRVADARVAAAQHASAGATHDADAHQLRRRPLWPRGALAAWCARRSDGPTVEAIAARAAQQMTAGRMASTDVVPLIASNYFPPSGVNEEASACAVISLIFPVLVLLITCTNVSALLAGLGVARRREIAVAARPRRGPAPRRSPTRDRDRRAGDGRRCAGAVRDLAAPPAVRRQHSGPRDRDRLAQHRVHVRPGSRRRHAVRIVAGAARHSSGAAGGAQGFGRRRRLTTLAAPILAGGRADRLHAARPAGHGRTAAGDALGPGGNCGRSPTPIASSTFNVNPRYGSLDAERERTLVRLQERLAAVPGVAGVVRQEHRDSLARTVHPADIVAGLELASPQQVDAIAAPATSRSWASRSHEAAISTQPSAAATVPSSSQRPGTTAVGRRRCGRPAARLGGSHSGRHRDVHRRRCRGRCDDRRARPGAASPPSPGHP